MRWSDGLHLVVHYSAALTLGTQIGLTLAIYDYPRSFILL